MNTGFLSVQVASKYQVAQDIISLKLVDPNGGSLPEFSPGAHIDVYLPGGYIRQYSLLNDVRERDYFQIGVLREPQSRGGSTAIHDLVQVGDLLQISTPRNRFQLVNAEHSLLFAGGIGITPLMCMAYSLQAVGAKFNLHYSCRSRGRAAFLDKLQCPEFVNNFHGHFSDEPQTALDIHTALAQADDKTHIYVCGPAGYIEYILDQAKLAGIEDNRLHFERFTLDANQHSVAETGDNNVFQVQIASTGEIFEIPADESIAHALDRQGVFIPLSCEEGICGTCLTGVQDGIPEHRDSYLTEEEHLANDQITLCCSRSVTPMLVLDL